MEMKPARGKAKFVHENNVTLVQLKPLEKESTTVLIDEIDAETTEMTDLETTELISSSTYKSSTSTSTESILKLQQAKIAARSRSRQVANKKRISLLKLQVVDRNRVGKIQARNAGKQVDNLRPKPFRKYAGKFLKHAIHPCNFQIN